MRLSDEICTEFGLPVIREKSGISQPHRDWTLRSLGLPTGADLLNRSAAEALSLSLDRNDFCSLMEERGYTVSLTDGRLTFLPHGKTRPMTARVNGIVLRDEDIGPIIEQGLAAFEQETEQEETDPPAEAAVSAPYPPSLQSLPALYARHMETIRSGSEDYREILSYVHYDKELAYLRSAGIETERDLTKRLNAVREETAALLERRSVLNPKSPETREERIDISKKLRKLRSEDALLERIGRTSEHMKRAAVRDAVLEPEQEIPIR